MSITLEPMDDTARAHELAKRLRQIDWTTGHPARRAIMVVGVINTIFDQPLQRTAAGWIMSAYGQTTAPYATARTATDAWCDQVANLPAGSWIKTPE